MKYIGNDGPQPFRVMGGGKAAIDKRLSKLYDQKYLKKLRN